MFASSTKLLLPAVLTELLSDPKLRAQEAQLLVDLPMVPLESGYWQRAGELRAVILRKSRRARLGDALIAQSCIGYEISLLTRDQDFRVFAQLAGLALVVV